MTDNLKPVVFKITLDTTEAQKQLDALSKGGGKGTPTGKGVPQAPKPGGGAASGAVGERGGVAAASPGRGAVSAQALAAARGGFAGGSQAALGGFVGSVNRAVLNPVAVVEGAASGALGVAAAAVGLIATSAIFLEQVVPLILESLADSLPDMPFFKDYAREFDNEVSDKITELRTWITSVIPTLSETGSIDKAILQADGKLTGANTLGLFKDLLAINHQEKRFNADIEKEVNKVLFKGVTKSFVEGMGY